MAPATPYILHIATRAAWQEGQRLRSYRPASLSSEGFIHCSTPAQILNVANALYRGRHDLVLLVIDVACLTAPVRYEDCYASGQDYPHLYGPLNLEAVIAVYDFPPQADGTFRLPDELSAFLAASSDVPPAG